MIEIFVWGINILLGVAILAFFVIMIGAGIEGRARD